MKVDAFISITYGDSAASEARRCSQNDSFGSHFETSLRGPMRLLRNSLDRFLTKDMKGWTDLCDENVVAEFPFAPEGPPAKIEGRTALYEYLRNYPSFIGVRAIPAVKMYATDDPNVALAEWHASGRVIGNGNPYEMSYATFVTFRQGLIANYREYWNPMAFVAAMAGTRCDNSAK